MFAVTRTINRRSQIPTEFNEITRETIHASVLEQDKIDPLLSSLVDKHLVKPLMPAEEELRSNWPKLLNAGKEISDHVHT